MTVQAINTRKTVGFIVLLTALTGVSLGAQAAEYHIAWGGANGYNVQGQFSFANSLINSGPINASDLTGFSFSVYKGSTALGSWNAFANGLAPGYKFNFNFDTTTGQLLTGGYSSSRTGQDWSDVTGGSRCPSSGVGFSSGSYGQVLCVHGRIASDSMMLVAHSTLFAQSYGPLPISHTTTPTTPAVPVPATAWLFGSGLLSLVGVMRKRRRSR